MKQYKHKYSKIMASRAGVGGPYLMEGTITFIPQEIVENGNDWEEIKPKLFITEDGIDIYVNDVCYGVNPLYYSYTGEFQWRSKEYFGDGKQVASKLFSTKEVAEEYILMNKPLLSINDIINLQGLCDGKFEDYHDINKLKELAKSKLK